jgi:hypothetical protein
MKTITNKTILKQGDKEYQPMKVDGVIYWVDKNPKGFSKGEWMYNEPNNDTLIYQFSYDIHPYEIGNKIVAQSQLKLEGIPVISLDSYVEKLAWVSTEKIFPEINDEDSTQVEIDKWNAKWEGFIDGYKSNPNQYTKADIEKALFLKAGFDNKGYTKYMTNEEIFEQINSISVIEVNDNWEVISYE